MKQYDFVRAWKDDADYDIEGPVILLTIEELREVWDKGYLRACEEYAAKYYEYDGELVAPSFTTYLTSKGVTIP